MSYLVEASVLRELSRRRPDANVVRWLESVPEESLHVSVLSLGELRSAVEKVADRKRREKLRVFLERDLPRRLEGRVLAVDAAVAGRWGRLVAEGGRPVPTAESLLAATALEHGLRVATGNPKAFVFPGLEAVNPWEA